MLHHALLAATYADSVVLMQLQRALAATPGVFAAAAVMATPANRELLAAQALLPAEAAAARPDDLLVAVRAASAAAAEAALRRVPELLRGERGAEGGAEHRVRSLAAALRELPEAGWVAISVPGRWAGAVAREALAQGRHVFLFSDNVPLEEEVALKAEAARRGLLLLGPDCGTALIGGVGLGFANRVRRGPVGIVAASGTGLQAVACSVHARGGGVSHALGTGGRDFGEAVGGATALQALDLLRRDPQTDVVALLGKPPAARVAARLLQAAGACGKPVVAWFLGSAAASRRVGDVWFATSSAEAAELAAGLVGGTGEEGRGEGAAAATSRLHGLFAGGTLAQEALLGLLPWLGPIASNLSLPGALPLADPAAGGA
ncbi:MAG TPA: hypothetical protein VMT16_05685, partial [Thermoanaerobaculia bacterium]|nr:hypothetical protein [Thermoanaerobaculia bacterium]